MSVGSPVRLQDSDLVLRKARDTDRVDIEASFADPLLRTWYPWPTDVAAVTDVVQRLRTWSDPTSFGWVIARPDGDDRLMGVISMRHYDQTHRSAEVGYWLAPWARGRGLATRSVRLASDWAAGDLALRRLALVHSVANTASCAVAERAGFDLEGTMRQSMRYPDGTWHDEHLHALAFAARSGQ